VVEDAENAEGEESEIDNAYDNNGNTQMDAQGRVFTCDFENRLMQVIDPGDNGGTTTFRYDPFGRRIQNSGPLATTKLPHSNQNRA
jgi:YD repeat-containing protein